MVLDINFTKRGRKVNIEHKLHMNNQMSDTGSSESLGECKL